MFLLLSFVVRMKLFINNDVRSKIYVVCQSSFGSFFSSIFMHPFLRSVSDVLSLFGQFDPPENGLFEQFAPPEGCCA